MYKNQAEYCVAKKAKVRSYDYFDILLGNWDDIVVVSSEIRWYFIIYYYDDKIWILHITHNVTYIILILFDIFAELTFS